MAVVKIRNSYRLLLLLLVYGIVPAAAAEWLVGHQSLPGTDTKSITAHTENDAGYGLMVYRNADTVLARFTVSTGLPGMDGRYCPTYQIDKGVPDNRSFDATPCSMGNSSADFLLGRILSNRVRSSLLLTILNGTRITFRLRLADGTYRETVFSLAGSKRAMTEAIGRNILIASSDAGQ